MINTSRLRNLIGCLGMLLPWIVLALSLIYTGVFPDSISATWYLPECVTPFMIILGAAGVLLISYRGYDSHDDLICTLAGIFGLCICIFPCNCEELNKYWTMIDYPSLVGTFQLSPNISGWIHNISAIGFFGLLSYNSLFLFTKSNGLITARKAARNKIFRFCGIGMLISLCMIIPVTILENLDINTWGAIWIIETVALAFFGISWLTKANIYSFLFMDQDYQQIDDDNIK